MKLWFVLAWALALVLRALIWAVMLIPTIIALAGMLIMESNWFHTMWDHEYALKQWPHRFKASSGTSSTFTDGE